MKYKDLSKTGKLIHDAIQDVTKYANSVAWKLEEAADDFYDEHGYEMELDHSDFDFMQDELEKHLRKSHKKVYKMQMNTSYPLSDILTSYTVELYFYNSNNYVEQLSVWMRDNFRQLENLNDWYDALEAFIEKEHGARAASNFIYGSSS